MRMAREGLVAHIKPAVDQAKKSGAAVTHEGVRVRYEDGFLNITLEVIPMKFSGADHHFIVLFKESPRSPRAKNKKQAGGRREIPKDDGLWRELAATKDHLQSTIEGPGYHP